MYSSLVLVQSHGPRLNVKGEMGEEAGFVEGGEGEEENERADVSEVIEATGHPGRKSHESRASGREQCRAALLVRLLLLPSPLPRGHHTPPFPLPSPPPLLLLPLGTGSSLPPRSSNVPPELNRYRHCSASPLYLLDLIRAAD